MERKHGFVEVCTIYYDLHMFLGFVFLLGTCIFVIIAIKGTEYLDDLGRVWWPWLLGFIGLSLASAYMGISFLQQ